MPRPAELALFRVLQESLTNIHRHSKSARADVFLGLVAGAAVLRIRDYGKGMARDTLQNFLNTGARVGVGLAGMRERIREQGGRLDIQSNKNGTTISVTLPMAAAEDASTEFEAATPAD
jgi:signal transduction histidine kinase